MKCLASVLFSLTALVSGHLSAQREHPIVNVIGLLENMIEKVKMEGSDEKGEYENFQGWCSSEKTKTSKSIADGKENIRTLEEQIEGNKADHAAAVSALARLSKQKTQLGADEGEATSNDKTAAALYKQAKADVDATIQAIKDAVTAVKGAKAGTALVQQKVESLLQLQLVDEELTSSQREVASMILAGDPPPKKEETPYTFKGGNVLALLEDLQTHFEDKEAALTGAETQRLNSHQLALNDFKALTEANTASEQDETKARDDAKGSWDSNVLALGSAKEGLKGDQDMLASVTLSCRAKADVWDQRSEVREKELKAMNDAIFVLKQVIDVRHETPINENPEAAIPKFLQVGSVLNPAQERAVNLLRKEAAYAKSGTFEKFVEQFSASVVGEPMEKVKNMIQKMIFRLMKEQNDEDERKAWCDQELQVTKDKQTHETGRRDEFGDKLQAEQDKITVLKGNIDAANTAIAGLQKGLDEATEKREVGKDENKKAIADAEEALDALGKAIAVLTKFYEDAGQEVKLVQTGAKQVQPATSFDGAYQGTEGSPAVVKLKEVEASFQTMLADTKASEITDTKTFSDFKRTCEVRLAEEKTNVKMKTEQLNAANAEATDLAKKKKQADKLRYDAEKYLKDLEQACGKGLAEDNNGYEARKTARTNEIDSLKEVSQILFPETPSFLAQIRRVQ